jgi:hypothetical protein
MWPALSRRVLPKFARCTHCGFPVWDAIPVHASCVMGYVDRFVKARLDYARAVDAWRQFQRSQT